MYISSPQSFYSSQNCTVHYDGLSNSLYTLNPPQQTEDRGPEEQCWRQGDRDGNRRQGDRGRKTGDKRIESIVK